MTTQFQAKPTGQDNQWSDPTMASPLAALSYYLNGISATGLDQGMGQGGDTGSGGDGPQGELYSTSAYDQNVSNDDSSRKALQDALAQARKYDPNAQLEYYDPSAGSEGGTSTPMVRIKMDQSKLPKAPTLPGGIQLLSGVRTANNQTPNAGQGPHLYNQSYVFTDPNWGPYTARANINQSYGQNPYTDVGFWGPLVTGAVIGGAGAGMLPGFGGASNATSLANVAGAAGEAGAGASAPVSSILGMSPGKFGNTALSIGRNVTSGNTQGAVGAGLSAISSALGLPRYVSPLLNLGLQQAMKDKDPRG